MLCSKMLLNSPPVKFLLWGFQGPQPLTTIPTAAHLSTMYFRHFICVDSASGWHPRSDSPVFSLLEGVNKDQSPHQGEHSPTVLGNILTQANGLLVPLCPCPREFYIHLIPFSFLSTVPAHELAMAPHCLMQHMQTPGQAPLGGLQTRPTSPARCILCPSPHGYPFLPVSSGCRTPRVECHPFP